MKKKKIEQHGDDESSDDDSSDDNLEDSEEDEDENDNNENVLDEAEMTSSTPASTSSITSSIEIAPPTADDENLSVNEIENDNLYANRYNLIRIEGQNDKFKRARLAALSSPEITKKPQLAKNERVRRFADFSDSDSDGEITFKKN